MIKQSEILTSLIIAIVFVVPAAYVADDWQAALAAFLAAYTAYCLVDLGILSEDRGLSLNGVHFFNVFVLVIGALMLVGVLIRRAMEWPLKFVKSKEE